MSAQPCGCDMECKTRPHYCERHLHMRNASESVGWLNSVGPLTVSPQATKEVVKVAERSETVQQFASGATRNADTNKFDFEGFLNPEVLHAFGHYMHEHRLQRDGSVRDSDNWQKGIPFKNYVRSLVRHTFDLWRMHRGYSVLNPDTGKPHTKEELCCAIMFNAMGYLKELLDTSPINREEQ
jgi:hypothetical protein